MQVEIIIDEKYEKPKIVIFSNEMTEEVNMLVKQLSEESLHFLVGIKEDKVEILDPVNIFLLYSADKKVFALTNHGEYLVRTRLYELEAQMTHYHFVRISNTEIINMKKVVHFDLSFTGTICVSLSNGTVTYVSRRYVSKIKKILGM